MKNKIQKILTEAMNQYDDFWNAVWSGNSMSHRAVIEKYFPPFAHLKGLPHNPEKHPEGDVDVHVFLVIDAVASEKDKDLSLAAVFHDMSKSNTFSINPKTNQPAYHGHENISADYVRYYRDLIESMGCDYYKVLFMVQNHMKFHNIDQMSNQKRKDLENHVYFEDLKKLCGADHAVRM